MTHKRNTDFHRAILFYDSKCPMCCAYINALDKALGNTICNLQVCTSVHTRGLDKGTLSIAEMQYIESCMSKTIVLAYPETGEIHLRSTAIALMLKNTQSPLLRLLASIAMSIPISIADTCYNVIARHRLSISKVLFHRNRCSLSLENIEIVS